MTKMGDIRCHRCHRNAIECLSWLEKGKNGLWECAKSCNGGRRMSSAEALLGAIEGPKNKRRRS